MTVDPTRATESAPGGDPTGTGTGAATDPNARETPEQEVARLRAALEQSKAEKSTLEEAKRERDALMDRIAQLEAGGTPPTPPPPAHPGHQLLNEIAQYEQIVAAEPNNYAAQRFLRQAKADLIALQWQALREREMPRLMRSDEKYRAKAIELFDTGRYLTAEDALLAARGALLSDDELDKARKKAADEAAARLAANKPDTGGGSGTESGVATQKRVYTGSEINRLQKENPSAARKLWQQIDSGQVEVNWNV